MLNLKELSMKNIILWICTVLSFAAWSSCNRSSMDYKGIPATAELVAEDAHYVVFTNVEGYEDNTRHTLHDPPLEQISLWAFDKRERKAERMMLSHLYTRGERYNTTESFLMPADSIETIHKVVIISFPEEPLTMLVESCTDYRNRHSYILTLVKDEAICLPTNRGFIGFSEQEHFLIMQSYEYYPCGGRYNRIEAFDCEGKRICSMDAMIEEYLGYPSIEELCGMEE